MATLSARSASRIHIEHPYWVLAALVAAGAFFRLIDLGTLSFRWDEDLSSLAAKAIAERGVPELPSGMVYLRSLPFLYVLAGSGQLWGFAEWSLRLPAALFGIATIPLAFAFGRQLFGTSVGLVLAALVTFSVWDIEFSRYARMYAPFEFFYLLTLLCIWRYRVVSPTPIGGVLCIAVALVAVSLHALGYTLALAFLVPLLLEEKSLRAEPRRLVFPVIAFGTVAAGYFTWSRIQSYYYNRAAIQADDTVAARETSSTPLDPIVSVLERIVTQLQPPPVPAFGGLAETLPLVAAAMLLAPLLGAFVFAFRRRGTLPAASKVWLLIIALCCGFQLFNLALLATIALAFMKRRGLSGLRDRDVGVAVGLIAASFVVWLSLTVGLNLLPGAGVREAVRELLNYPAFFVFWGFPNEYPLLSIPALVGGLWVFDRIARERPQPQALFLLAVFALPMILNGMFATRYENFRYNVPFGPLYFTFVALGILKWRDVLAAWQEGREHASLGRPRPALITAALVAAVLAFDMNPLRAWLATQRAYANEGALYSFFDLRGFRDFRSVADYVEAHAANGDRIITFDCREYFNYLARLDYCLVSGTYREGDQLIQTYLDEGTRRDLYLGTPMLMGLDDLRRTLHGGNGSTWLLASDSMMADLGSEDEELRRFLEASRERVVHVARDGDTKVYRF